MSNPRIRWFWRMADKLSIGKPKKLIVRRIYGAKPTIAASSILTHLGLEEGFYPSSTSGDSRPRVKVTYIPNAVIVTKWEDKIG